MDFTEWLEDQVRNNERRIKNIEEHPDPVKLKSNKLIYQLERETRLAQLAAIREGKSCVTYPGGGLGDLLRAMGFEFFNAGALNEKSLPGLSRQSREAFSAAGYPEEVCDLADCEVAWTEMGVFPPMSCYIRCNSTCQPMADSALACALRFGKPVYNLTIPMDPFSKEDIGYVVEQLEDLITWLEKNVPGVHYSEDTLEEWLDAEAKLAKNFHRIWEARKHKPCPNTARDSFREEMPCYIHNNKDGYVEWSRLWAEEMDERIATGTHLPKEKIRLAWSITAPIYDAELFPWLEEQGVTIPVFLWPSTDWRFTILPKYEVFGANLSPLEKVARMSCRISINGLADRLMGNFIDSAREQDVDGFVFYSNRGCAQTQGAVGLVAREVQKLGIPFLVLKGTQVDDRGYNKAETWQRLEEFIQLVLASKAGKV